MPRLDLQIDDDDEHRGDGLHVHGIVRTETGDELPFVGWVGLMALLQRAVSGDVQARAPR